jgi:hypothetical protein
MPSQYNLGCKLIHPTKSQILNIRSNWISIIGSIREHNLTPESHFNKYGVTHIIRQIDSYYSFPITINLQNTLNRIGCDLIYLKQSDRHKLNQTLKINNIDDSIQIEHFNGGVERLIQILLLEINNTSSNLETRINSCMEIHNTHTACCYKLVKGDKDLNANTKESDYISKIYISNNIGHSN